MFGFGKILGGDGILEYVVKEKEFYFYLIDDNGNWMECVDVCNVCVMGSGMGGMCLIINEWMMINGGNIGLEIGIGYYVGYVIDVLVLIFKSCIGNCVLGWDLFFLGSEGFEYIDDKGVIWMYFGYKGLLEWWEKGIDL